MREGTIIPFPHPIAPAFVSYLGTQTLRSVWVLVTQILVDVPQPPPLTLHGKFAVAQKHLGL